MNTRQDYLADKCTHREYYAQFVTESTLSSVRQSIGLKRLKASTDEHLNDIPLKEWDNTVLYGASTKMKECNDWLSPAGKVCILKEAARQLIEA